MPMTPSPAMSALSSIDWVIIFLTLSLSLVIGLLVRNKVAEGGVAGYFVAGRDMPWWLLGTSMVATTFASDTPLVITGWVAAYGISGNWFWWGGVTAAVAVATIFARHWRASGVMTDAELCELRYGGSAATTLRTFKAALNALVVNSVVLGWVLAGMAKIAEPFMDWRRLLGDQAYSFAASLLPEYLVFQSIDNSITLIVLLSVTVTYSALGGLRAVILTDLFQFLLAIVMSILFSVLVVQSVGGLEAMWLKLETLYPVQSETLVAAEGLSHEAVRSFIPAFGDSVMGGFGMPFSAFLMTIGVLWWTNAAVDGSGFTAQRLCTARTESDAEKGALWFAFAHFVLRSWPWIIVGVAALVVYPQQDVERVVEAANQCEFDSTRCSVEMRQCLDDRYQCEIREYALLYRADTESQSTTNDDSDQVPVVFQQDRERAYPALLKDILPAGLLGLALASLMAAFMSTVSTLINWGAAYLVNDVYVRFINRAASGERLLIAGRLATVMITVLAVMVAASIENIGVMWELYGGLMAGLGLPHLLRWLWWRANAWTEIAGMSVGFALALGNYVYGQIWGFPEQQISVLPAVLASHPIHVITWIALGACVAALVATVVTKPVEPGQLALFVKTIRPNGFWGSFSSGSSGRRSLNHLLLSCLISVVSIYAGLFGIGFLLRLEPMKGLPLVAVSIATLIVLVRRMDAIDLVKTDVEVTK